jgi:hypothetical protein
VEEEENNKNQGHEEVSCLEELVVPVADSRIVLVLAGNRKYRSRPGNQAHRIHGMDMNVNHA